MKILAERLKELLKENNMQQIELAYSLNFSRTQINNWCTNRFNPDLEQIATIAEFFGVSIDYLIGRSDDFGNIKGQKEELTPSERELLQKYRAISPEGKEKAIDYIELIKGDEERKKIPHGGIFGKQKA